MTLLDKLREERGRHRIVGGVCHSLACGAGVPCVAARALDCAIAGLQGLLELQSFTLEKDGSDHVRATWAAMSRAYEGKEGK